MFRFINFVVAALAFFVLTNAVAAKDKVINFKTGDPEMAAAIDKARKSLDQFWKMYASPQPGVSGFSLKVAIREPNNDNTEHFWLGKIRRLDDGKLSGIINNDPNYIRSVRRGQSYTFTSGMISDWMFYRNGKIVGAETMRPMIKRMPKAQADRYRAMLERP